LGKQDEQKTPRERQKTVFDYLKTLSPSAIELEFISLSDFDVEDIRSMLLIFRGALEMNGDQDFIHACLNNFLKSHHEAIVENSELGELLESQVEPLIRKNYARFEDLMQSSICMTEHFSGIQQN